MNLEPKGVDPFNLTSWPREDHYKPVEPFPLIVGSWTRGFEETMNKNIESRNGYFVSDWSVSEPKDA